MINSLPIHPAERFFRRYKIAHHCSDDPRCEAKCLWPKCLWPKCLWRRVCFPRVWQREGKPVMVMTWIPKKVALQLGKIGLNFSNFQGFDHTSSSTFNVIYFKKNKKIGKLWKNFGKKIQFFQFLIFSVRISVFFDQQVANLVTI